MNLPIIAIYEENNFCGYYSLSENENIENLRFRFTLKKQIEKRLSFPIWLLMNNYAKQATDQEIINYNS
jgi:hypothetical protein